MGRVVELAGLPGTGKSTLTAGLLAEGEGLGSVIVEPAERNLLHRHPGVAARALTSKVAERSWQTQHRAAYRRLARRSLGQDLVVRDATGFLLIEEGIIHRIWGERFLDPSLAVEPWQRLLRPGPPIVVLEASAACRWDRVTSKPPPGRVNRALSQHAADSDLWARSAATYEEVVAAAGTVRTVIRVDTSGTPEAALERLRDAIGAPAPVRGARPVSPARTR